MLFITTYIYRIPKCTKNPIFIKKYISKLGASVETVYKNIECTIRKGALYVNPPLGGVRSKGNNFISQRLWLLYRPQIPQY